MNERIRELTRQAGISILYEYDGYDGHAAVANLADIEKFAELMVAECCQVLSKETIRHDGYGYNQHALYQKIKEHFGVEK